MKNKSFFVLDTVGAIAYDSRMAVEKYYYGVGTKYQKELGLDHISNYVVCSLLPVEPAMKEGDFI